MKNDSTFNIYVSFFLFILTPITTLFIEVNKHIVMQIKVFIAFIILMPLSLSGHPGHQDPVYAELNDYLMAIQIMRYEDPRADEIFKIWNQLREASWKIRELTDEQNLFITSQQVMDQIATTKRKQRQLLFECRKYFAEIIEEEPAIRIAVNKSLSIDWDDPIFEIPVQHTKVLLVEIQNNSDSSVNLSMTSNLSDEILFWNKQFTLVSNSSRFTFVVCSPLKESLASNNLQIVDNRGNKTKAIIQVRGIPTTDPPYQLAPGETITKVTLPLKRDQIAAQPEDFADGMVFNITDQETGDPIPARVKVTDENNNAYWSPLKGQSLAIVRDAGWGTNIWEHQPGPYFYLKGETSLGVKPEGKTVDVKHGFEYIPQSITVPENGIVKVALKRWINMPRQGWFSGHTHIHTTDVGIPVQFNQHWPLVSQAEDLHVSAILSLKGEWMTHAIYANEYPMGERQAFGTDDYIVVYGEEFRNNPFGHLAFIGLDQLIQPISSGALGELGGPDYPPNTVVLDEALRQGANTIAAHFGNFTKDVTQVKSSWPSTGFEMPVDIALGKIQLAEIYGNGGQLDVWYDVLNCGFRVPATAGPDWVIKDTPRVYVFLDGQTFSFDNWRDGLRKGRSFITKGPMLFFEVNGQKPGGEIAIKTGSNQVRITAEAKIPEGSRPVEILFNGDVIYSGSDIDANLTLNDSGWLAARCEGAHSNPVYVDFEGRPAGFSAPAIRFIGIIDRLQQWVNDKGLFDSEDQKKEVLSVLTQGKEVYQKIVEQAKERGNNRTIEH